MIIDLVLSKFFSLVCHWNRKYYSPGEKITAKNKKYTNIY